MPHPHPDPALPSDRELSNLSRTLAGLAPRPDHLASRLQHVADLLADAGKLPDEPILVWRDKDQTVNHAVIGSELVVGRQPGGAGLALAGDKLLSRRHFAARVSGETCVMEDLDSRNGTAVNQAGQRVHRHTLRDGDLILAGHQLFVFLDQRQTA